jgi:hypothetical protein
MPYGSGSYGSTEYAGLLGGALPVPPVVVPAGIDFTVAADGREVVLRRQDDPSVPLEDREIKAMPSAIVQCTTFVKDPSAVKDYDVDWSEILDAGETITSSNWAGGGLTTSGAYILDDKCYVFLAGGTLGTIYIVGNSVVTSAGRAYTREFRVSIERT